ncbi:MAG: redoxin domain-containing protein, partial [Acidimicrobiales bacterium]
GSGRDADLPEPTGPTGPTGTTGTTGTASSPAGGPPPRRLRALLIGTVVAAGLAVVLFVGLGTTSGSGPGAGPVVGVGDTAPAFSVPSLTGGPPVDLDALGAARHRPVVLNFFASWCAPCRQETPLLARTAAAERARHSTVQFIGIDVADSAADAIPFVNQSGITYPVGTDSSLRVAATLYGLNGEPSTFFIDSSGQVVAHVLGPVDQAQLDRWLHRLTA